MPNLTKGHRERMRKRLRRCGTDAMESYELLEMLLYHILPRRDTYPISKNLINTFGGVDGIFKARRADLLSVNEVGEGTADFILAAAQLINADKSFDGQRSNFLTKGVPETHYLDFFKDIKVPISALTSLDNSANIISTKIISDCDLSEGNTASAALAAAIEEGAALAVIAHSHPFGLPYPTDGDRAAFLLLERELQKCAIPLIGSYIISGNDVRGFENEKLKSLAVDDNHSLENAVQKEDLSCLLRHLLSFSKAFDESIPDKLFLRFKTKHELFSADTDTLYRVTKSEAISDLLSLVFSLYSRCTTDKFKAGKTHSKEETEAFISSYFFTRGRETLIMLSLDSENKLISYDKLAEGSIGEISVSPRVVLEKAYRLGAKHIILAHNHPGGNVTASEEDNLATQILASALRAVGSELSAHYISAGDNLSLVTI